jgi:hypothetical protein
MLKGLAAGTGDGLHTSIIGEAPAQAALPRQGSRDQLKLDALKNYFKNPSGAPCSRSSPFAEGGMLDASLAVAHI